VGPDGGGRGAQNGGSRKDEGPGGRAPANGDHGGGGGLNNVLITCSNPQRGKVAGRGGHTSMRYSNGKVFLHAYSGVTFKGKRPMVYGKTRGGE